MITSPPSPTLTPDGRYLIVRGRLWRSTNPHLDAVAKQLFINALMSARRAVASAKRQGDIDSLKRARAEVQAAKVSLGERGPVWWSDGAPDYGRRMLANTPYGQGRLNKLENNASY